jgi:hypothetical protein
MNFFQPALAVATRIRRRSGTGQPRLENRRWVKDALTGKVSQYGLMRAAQLAQSDRMLQ